MGPEALLLAKIITSAAMVVGLTLVAEHVSPRVAGVLSGYPLGVAIALFFIGIENGAEFAASSAIYTVAGFTASLVLVYVYYQVAHRCQRWQVFIAATISVIAFALAAGLLRTFHLTLVNAALITIIAMAVAIKQFSAIANVRVDKRVGFSVWVLVIRAATATAIVLIITGLAAQVGTRWAGVMSAFPITLFPFMLILHLTYGADQVSTVIKNFPLGMGSLLTYTATVALAYPTIGVGMGTALGFATATGYLVVLAAITQRQQQKAAQR
ncbi:MAG: hypothetical protein KUG81_05070 [Gammaproteobacteria bacterium]|nr:hypothetical protein [Gammaproteobacteria bacterium]